MNKRNDRRYDLPPLDALPTFEAAARSLSFTRAGQELALTQSAVSKQLKLLEDRLGAALFERTGRSLVLTEAGRTLQATASDALDRLQLTVDDIRRSTRPSELTVTMTSGMASMWLIPRLARFTARHPDVDVRISATMTVLDLARDRIDLAIRFATPEAVPANSPKLFDEQTVAVCAPALLADPAKPLRRPADLTRHTLLRYEFRSARGAFLDWETWLSAHGHPDLEPAHALTFNQTDQAIQAAVAGQGVALGQYRLVADLIASGVLATPFGIGTLGDRAFYVVRNPSSGIPAKRRRAADAFVAWLIDEARDAPS